MGSCVMKNTSDTQKFEVHSARVRKDQGLCLALQTDIKQLECLGLIYEDLASRAPDHKMNEKIFEVFFHMNPTFSTPLFLKFCNGTEITKEIFSQSILKYFKDGVEKRLRFLFCLYDIDESHGICFKELLFILLNSPQDQLKEVLSKDAFLQTLTLEEMSYYLMSKIIQNQTTQDLNNMTLFPYLPCRRKGSGNQIDPALANFALSMDLRNNQDFKRVSSASTDLSSKRSMNSLNPQNEHQSQDSQCQLVDKNRKIIQQQFKKKINLSLHSTHILRRYAEYVFAKNNLDKQHGEISYQQFRYIAKENPKIYKQGLQGFHQYLWRHEKGVPKYKTIIPTIAGYCLQVSGDIKKTIYLTNIKNSLIIFFNEGMNMPIAIKNLQGLNIEAAQSDLGYGFAIKHQDGYYPSKIYLFPTKQTQSLWLDALAQYQQKDVFKKYKLQEKIGQGSFCNVYKCTNLETNAKRAMKIIDKMLQTEQDIDAVNSESQILATCAMRNVVRAYQRFETKNSIYLIMQLIEEGTLHQYASKNGGKSLTQLQGKRIMKALLQTIKNLHEIGIIHRDLKLENILVKLEDGKFIPKIIDFGLSIYKLELAHIEEKRKFVGTPNFVPPQILFHEEYDQTVDIFSLGVILHFILTGTLPFHGINFAQIRQLTIDCHINFEAKKWRYVSQSAKDLVKQMVCYRQHRITAQEAVNHPWFTESRQ